MLRQLRKIHLYFGWLVVWIFVLTGQYMRHVIHPAMEADATYRFSIRANHVYILLFGLLHLLAGAYFQPMAQRNRMRLQQAGSLMLFVATVIVLAAFAFETKVGAERPISLAAMVAGVTGIGLHLLAVRNQSR
jgi:hypothetical protein